MSKFGSTAWTLGEVNDQSFLERKDAFQYARDNVDTHYYSCDVVRWDGAFPTVEGFIDCGEFYPAERVGV